jgi:hypothetical protein
MSTIREIAVDSDLESIIKKCLGCRKLELSTLCLNGFSSVNHIGMFPEGAVIANITCARYGRLTPDGAFFKNKPVPCDRISGDHPRCWERI